MKNSMQYYKKRLIVLCIMLAVVLMITGVSYAIFTSYSSQPDTNTLSASCMDLEFNGQNEINLLNTYPISDGEALEQTPYTFTIKNNCDNYIEYYVIASVISSTNNVDSKYVKVSLLGDSDLGGTIINKLETISTPQSLSKYNISENYVLKSGDGISKNESRTFNFRMWLDADNKDIWTSEDVENKEYQVKISVVGTVKTRPKDDLYVAALIDGEESTTFPTTSEYKASVECTRNGKKVNANSSIIWNDNEWELTAKITTGNTRCNITFTSGVAAPKGWYSAKKNTLLGSIRNTNPLEETLTIPGTNTSIDDEAVLASAPDDYGTSYYFRGAIKNNYVEFANKCWRIVRVTGDGSIKLALHNDNVSSVTNPCSSANNSENAGYARYSGTTYTTKFNPDYQDNAYVGFMYGTLGASDYASTHANINKSTVLTNLETWYTNNLTSYSDKLADVIWCNDKSTENKEGGYGTVITQYGTILRVNSKSPTLVCPDDNNGGKLSKFTVSDTTNGNGNLTYKIGLLTDDEMIYSGYLHAAQETNSYLKENATEGKYWTLSPMNIHTNSDNNPEASVLIVSNGSWKLGVSWVSDGSVLLRPAVALTSSTIVSSGSGTSEDPYIVK